MGRRRAGCARTRPRPTRSRPAPTARAIFNVDLLEDGDNREDTIYRSKAVGEPPLMLAISVLHALSDAVASVAATRSARSLDAPATPERVLDAVERRAEAARRMRGRHDAWRSARPRATCSTAASRWCSSTVAAAGLDAARGRRAHAGHAPRRLHRDHRRRPARSGQALAPGAAGCWPAAPGTSRAARHPARARPSGQCCGGQVAR